MIIRRTVGIDVDWDGDHYYSFVETREDDESLFVELLECSQSTFPSFKCDAYVVEWPGGGQDFSSKGAKLKDGRKVNPVHHTIRHAVILAYKLHCEGHKVYRPSRQRLLASLGLRVGVKGNRDQWANDRLAEMGFADINEPRETRWRGTLLSNGDKRASMIAALFNWWDHPKTIYTGGAD